MQGKPAPCPLRSHLALWLPVRTLRDLPCRAPTSRVHETNISLRNGWAIVSIETSALPNRDQLFLSALPPVYYALFRAGAEMPIYESVEKTIAGFPLLQNNGFAISQAPLGEDLTLADHGYQ
jgi:hypothetical protein